MNNFNFCTFKMLSCRSMRSSRSITPLSHHVMFVEIACRLPYSIVKSHYLDTILRDMYWYNVGLPMDSLISWICQLKFLYTSHRKDSFRTTETSYINYVRKPSMTTWWRTLQWTRKLHNQSVCVCVLRCLRFIAAGRLVDLGVAW